MSSSILSEKKIRNSNKYSEKEINELRLGVISLIEKKFNANFDSTHEYEFVGTTQIEVEAFLLIGRGHLKEMTQPESGKKKISGPVRHRFYLKTKRAIEHSHHSNKKIFFNNKTFILIALVSGGLLCCLLTGIYISNCPETVSTKKSNRECNKQVIVYEQKANTKYEGLSISVKKILTVDNFKPLENKEDEVKAIQLSSQSNYLRHLQGIDYNTFNIMKEDYLPIDSPSFKRVDAFLQHSKMKPYFSTEDRKKIYLTPQYEYLFREGGKTNLWIFPEKRQKSLVILEITLNNILTGRGSNEIKSRLLLNNLNEIDEYQDFSSALRSITKNKGIDIEVKDNKIMVCMFKGESLIISMGDKNWKFSVEEIVNQVRRRGGRDLTILKFT